MAVRQVNEKDWTKDGRKWIYEVRYKDVFGKPQYKGSKKFHTKKEAQKAEREFLDSIDTDAIANEMTFKELCDKHFEYQQDKVKVTTLRNYMKRRQHLVMFDSIKLKDLNIEHFEEWKKNINKLDMETSTKNDLYKYLKCILNYGSKWYNYNFTSMYNKMTNFNNPNEMPKEMEFWTKDEFDKFIAVETDLRFKAAFETLYYCGLRSGELRGLTWYDVNLESKELSVNKNITVNLDGKKYIVTTPKTKSSYRTIPMPDVLVDDLIKLREMQNNYYDFNNKWYVFGSYEPLVKSALRDRKNKDCKLAGVKQIRIHDFRHSCASLLINNGANITMVAKYLGHTKIDETLNTYTHMFRNKLDDIVGTINRLNNK